MVIPGVCTRIWGRLTFEIESVELEMKRPLDTSVVSFTITRLVVD